VIAEESPEIGRLSAWLLAIRPATLTAAVVPVIVGTALAAQQGAARLGPATAALIAAVFIQIGTNLVNDVDDFQRGADSAARRGPVRVTQAGLLTARAVQSAACIAFGAAVFAGLYLCAVAGWPIAVLGIAAIGSGLAYTGGPWPFGYHGLGELFVFAFFGVGAVVGTHYVQAGGVSTLALAASIPVGALASAILVVNNVRDLETDRAAGKRTLAVRRGERAARRDYGALLAVAYAVPVLLWLVHVADVWVLLPELTLPWAIALMRTVLRCSDGPSFIESSRDAGAAKPRVP
jgi:1,4-dihydroxy-2-naphthoate octaprenyltransferase